MANVTITLNAAELEAAAVQHAESLMPGFVAIEADSVKWRNRTLSVELEKAPTMPPIDLQRVADAAGRIFEE